MRMLTLVMIKMNTYYEWYIFIFGSRNLFFFSEKSPSPTNNSNNTNNTNNTNNSNNQSQQQQENEDSR